MLVHGGRHGWAGVVGLAAAVGNLALLGMACGSRTSMLDADVYDGSSNGPDGVAGGATLPGSGTAGKSFTSSPGRAGSGPTTPGGPAPGLDTTLALTPCQQYCAGYGTQCKSRLEGKECLSTCQGEINGFGTSCQRMGIDALRCLMPFFSASGGDCNPAVHRALTQCSTIVTAFDSCKKSGSSSAKPTIPSPPLASCERTGGGDSTSCVESFSCKEGSYVTFCSPSPSAGLLDCHCVRPNGEGTSGLLAASGEVCLNALVLCQ